MLRLDERVFALLRGEGGSGERILCLSNLGDTSRSVKVDWLKDVGFTHAGGALRDLIAEEDIPLKEHQAEITLAPYQSRWLI